MFTIVQGTLSSLGELPAEDILLATGGMHPGVNYLTMFAYFQALYETYSISHSLITYIPVSDIPITLTPSLLDSCSMKHIIFHSFVPRA